MTSNTKSLAAWGIACLALSGIGSQARGDAAADRKAITGMYGRAVEAIKKKDTAFFKASETSDFKMKTGDGKVLNRQQSDAMMAASFQQMGPVSAVSMKPTSITVKGDTAVAMIVSSVTAKVGDAKSGMHSMSQTSTEKHLWLRTPSGWKVRRVETVKETMLMDGKPFDPKKMGGGP